MTTVARCLAVAAVIAGLAGCSGGGQGNEQIPYEVRLPEPLGERTLVDGACEDPEAELTVFCESGGIRHSP